MSSPKIGKAPVLVKEGDNVQDFADKLNTNRLTPIFTISNVTGEGLPKLKEFLSHV